MLVVMCRWLCVGGSVLVVMCWWLCVGGSVLVVMYWWLCVGGSVLVFNNYKLFFENILFTEYKETKGKGVGWQE